MTTQPIPETSLANDNQLSQPERQSIAGRNQKMAAALSSYARALTFENRSRRNLYRLAGLAPRARDRLFSTLLMLTVVFTLVIPMAASIIYYCFIASPIYASEVRFIVRSSAPLLSRDRYATNTVEPKAKIVQDTAVLLNYLNSPAIVHDLGKHTNLFTLFGRAEIDFVSRLRSDATNDDVLDYWEGRHAASVNPKSGIVELEVTAFSPKEARDLSQLVLQLSEQQINKLNSGMWNDLLISTQKDVDAATKEVGDLRGKLRDAQNDTGIFDIDLSAESISTVLTNIEASIAELQSRRTALSQSVEAGSPQLSDINRRLAGLEEQAKALRGRVAGSTSEANLADYSRIFDKLKLDLKMAEDKLQSSISELEKIKLVSSLQLVYVDNFTEPTLPDYAKYPRVLLSLLLSLLAFSGVCGASCGLVLFLRKKID